MTARPRRPLRAQAVAGVRCVSPTWRAAVAAMGALVALSQACGCASLGEGGVGGGGSGLPNRGLGGYELYADAETGDAWVVAAVDETIALRDPSALVRGDRVDLYFVASSPAGSQVQVVQSDDGARFGDPAEVAFDDPSVRGLVESPSVAEVEGRLLMAFQVGQGVAIGRSVSDDGVHFEVSDGRWLEPVAAWEAGGVFAPSLVLDAQGDLLLYYEARDAAGSRRVARAVIGADGVPLQRDVVVEPGAGCLGAAGDPIPCWDRDGVGAPEVRRAVTATDRESWRLVFTGYGGSETHLGFAFSTDGVLWTRYAYNPLFARSRVREDAGSNVLFQDRYLLYFSESRARGQGIALAVSDFGQPSEVFVSLDGWVLRGASTPPGDSHLRSLGPDIYPGFY